VGGQAQTESPSAVIYIQTASSPSAAPIYSASTTGGVIGHTHPRYTGYERCFWHPVGIGGEPLLTQCWKRT
jgi:hypothetical protein